MYLARTLEVDSHLQAYQATLQAWNEMLRAQATIFLNWIQKSGQRTLRDSKVLNLKWH